MQHKKASAQPTAGKRQPHKFTLRVCHWWYCQRCGLVALKNEPTEQAIKQGCDG